MSSRLTEPETSARRWVAVIHPTAPAKPALGAPCNGCGLCCLAEPCPVGMVVSRRRRGACAALRWVEASTAATPTGGAAAYRCGLIVAPQEQLPHWMQHQTPALARLLAAGLRRLASRFISAGSGCDADLVVEPATPAGQATGPRSEPSR